MHASCFVGNGEDEPSRPPATPVSDQTGLLPRTALIVDVGIGPCHGIPQPGETGVKEAEHTDAALDVVTLEGPDPTDLLSVGLPVIEDDEADTVSASYKLFGEKDLLAL